MVEQYAVIPFLAYFLQRKSSVNEYARNEMK